MEFGDKEHIVKDTHPVRYAIRMKTPNGDFWWTGRMADRDNDGHGAFLTFGWVEKCGPVYIRGLDAYTKAAHLEASLRRMFDIERIEVVPVQWSSVRGFQPVAEGEPA